MKRNVFLIVLACWIHNFSYAQTDSVFSRIINSAKDFKLDTSAAPNDKFTRKISELRSLRGGFNVSEALSFKMQEALQKKEISPLEFNKISTYFSTGNGKKLLDNAMVAIYKKHFSYKEVKQLIKFYKTSAGKKMAVGLPIIMLESLRATELIAEIYKAQ